MPILVLTVAVTPKLKAYAREVFAKSTESESTLMEIISGVETVKGMGVERSMRLKWERQYVQALDVQYRAQRFNIWVGFASQLFNSAITITILAVGAKSRDGTGNDHRPADRVQRPDGQRARTADGARWSVEYRFTRAGVAMERLGDVLDMEPEQKPEDIGNRIILPDVQAATSISKRCTSATAAANRPTCSRTSI